MTRPRTAALIVAAGRSTRAGLDRPKQFAMLGGRMVVAHSYDALSRHSEIDCVMVATALDQAARVEAALPDAIWLAGGETRRDTVRSGLESLATAGGFEQVLIHDAARPLLPAPVIDRLLAALDTHDGAVPVLPVVDTLARGGAELADTVSRDGLHRVQTPQGFRLDTILQAHREWPDDLEATDDAQMVRRAGGVVALVEGDAALEKLTFASDFAAAEARLAARLETRSATGFDVHRLEAGEELWLGGLLIPHDRGLSGHSDADVALHAIADALLGTIAAGDIGTHFPPTDPQWRGADSAQFLQHAAALIAAEGGRIDFIDLTLICEAPKIGPHRAAMRARIAQLLGLTERRVSVKATTTERLGFAGRGEGIAAQAIATISIPGEDR